MTPESISRERVVNRKAYQDVRDQLRRDHPGKYAAIAGGRLLTVADTFDEALAAVDQFEPCAEHFFVFGTEDDDALDPVYDY